MRASIRNHRVYLYIRDIIDISKLNTCQKEELHCKSTRRTSKHLTSAIGRKSLSFFRWDIHAPEVAISPRHMTEGLEGHVSLLIDRLHEAHGVT